MTYTPPNSIRVNGTLFTMSPRSFDLMCEGAALKFSDPESCWDSESRQSPFSTVADIEDEYCEDCEAASTTYCSECEQYLRKQGALS